MSLSCGRWRARRKAFASGELRWHVQGLEPPYPMRSKMLQQLFRSMRLSSWRRWLSNWVRPNAQPIRRFRPAVEGLEGREVPAFLAPVAVSAGDAPGALAVGDFNNDGRRDIAVLSTDHDVVRILLNKGNGVYGAPVSYAVGDAPAGIATADLNGDGRLDLVVSNTDSDDVSVLLGKGHGTFQSAV